MEIVPYERSPAKKLNDQGINALQMVPYFDKTFSITGNISPGQILWDENNNSYVLAIPLNKFFETNGVMYLPPLPISDIVSKQTTDIVPIGYDFGGSLVTTGYDNLIRMSHNNQNMIIVSYDKNRLYTPQGSTTQYTLPLMIEPPENNNNNDIVEYKKAISTIPKERKYSVPTMLAILGQYAEKAEGFFKGVEDVLGKLFQRQLDFEHWIDEGIHTWMSEAQQFLHSANAEQQQVILNWLSNAQNNTESLSVQMRENLKNSFVAHAKEIQSFVLQSHADTENKINNFANVVSTELQNIQQRAEELTKQNEDLAKKNENLNNELSIIRTTTFQTKEAASTDIRHLGGTVGTIQETIGGFQTMINGLRTEISNLKSHISTIENETNSIKQTVNTGTKQNSNDDLKKKIEDLSKQVGSFATQISASAKANTAITPVKSPPKETNIAPTLHSGASVNAGPPTLKNTERRKNTRHAGVSATTIPKTKIPKTEIPDVAPTNAGGGAAVPVNVGGGGGAVPVNVAGPPSKKSKPDTDCVYLASSLAKVLIEIVKVSSNGKSPKKGLIDEAYSRYKELKTAAGKKKMWVQGGCSSVVPEGGASSTAITVSTKKKSRKSADQFTRALKTFIMGLERYDDISEENRKVFKDFAASCPQDSRVWVLVGCDTAKPTGAMMFK